MRTPREGFEAIARQMEQAHDALKTLPPDVFAHHSELLGCIVAAHTSAILHASTLRKREAQGALYAMPAPTETRQ